MEENLTLQLKDIKPLLEIPDNSFYYYWGLIGLGAFLLLMGLVFLVIFLLKRRKINLKKGYLESLKTLNWKVSKDTAYKATYLTRLLAEDDEALTVLFNELEPILEQYKYKKEVGEANEETKEKLNHYVQVADERI